MADDYLEITEEMILGANTYVSLDLKAAIADVIAAMCAEMVKTRPSMPPMYKENHARKAQFMYGILRRYYFGITQTEEEMTTLKATDVHGNEVEQKVDWFMSTADYNLWASSHVMNQIERLKKSKNEEVRNKAFDLMYDFKGFEAMVNGVVREMLELNNEPCSRIMEMIKTLASPEYTEELKKQIEDLQKEATELAKTRKRKENAE